MNNFPIGPVTQKKAMKTKSGQLSRALNKILYNGATVDELTIEGSLRRAGWVTSRDQYLKDFDCGVPPVTPTGHRYKTHAILREIRDHLEYLAYEEVIP